jgi:uncharacterized protein YbjT (DUF2867 family)
MTQPTRRLILSSLAAAGLVRSARAQERAAAPPPPPSFTGQTVLVAGATGRTGKHVVSMLLAAGAKVRGFSRNVDKARQDVPQVQWTKADVREPASLKGLAKGADRVVFAIGSNSFKDPDNKAELVDFKGVVALAEEAKAAKAKQFVLISSMGMSKVDPNATTGFAAVMRYKRDGEKGLLALGIPSTIVRPSGLWDKPGGEHGIALLAEDIDVGAMISREDVAAVVVQSLAAEKAVGKIIHCFNIVAADANAWKRDFPKLA